MGLAERAHPPRRVYCVEYIFCTTASLEGKHSHRHSKTGTRCMLQFVDSPLEVKTESYSKIMVIWVYFFVGYLVTFAFISSFLLGGGVGSTFSVKSMLSRRKVYC
jgi:hypothetical protein